MTVAEDPIFAEAAALQLLPGLSGVRVCLMTHDRRHWFVRKAARSAEASPRLRGQAEKQQRFLDHGVGAIRTPRIHSSGERDGRFFFDMEYVVGTDAASHLRQASYADVAKFGDRLCRYLESAAAHPGEASPRPPFEANYDKLCAVQQKAPAIAPETLARMFSALEALRELASLQPTLCHGDLTLENIIVEPDGGLCFLDWLDAPFEHYWQDVAKLHQDVAGDWYRRSQPPIAFCALEHLSRRLAQTARRLDPRFDRAHAVLVAMSFVRIVPYVGALELDFVLSRIDHFARAASVARQKGIS